MFKNAMQKIKNILRKINFFHTPLYINKVIYSGFDTIVYWSDGTTTIAKCQEKEKYDREKGLSIAINKKFLKGEYLGKVFNDYCIDIEKCTN